MDSIANRHYPRQAYLARLVIPPGVPCALCHHTRSSHSMIIMHGQCHATLPAGGPCKCPFFQPECGCGHLLDMHTWGTPPNPWACSGCACLQFGARSAEQLSLP